MFHTGTNRPDPVVPPERMGQGDLTPLSQREGNEMREEEIKEIEQLSERMRQYAQIPGLFNAPANDGIVIQLRNDLQAIELIKNDYPAQKEYYDSINKVLIMLDKAHRPWINPIAFGQIVGILDMVINEEKQPTCWQCVHPLIQKSSKKLYMDGYYANAAVDAFIEINDRAKEIYKTIRPDEQNIPDGADLMNKLFSKNNPLVKLADIETETGANIQQGYQLMFSGSMSALRNPKAHSNTVILSAAEAIRRIMFASMLMYQLDEWDKQT